MALILSSRATRRRSGARNLASQSRHRYSLNPEKKHRNRSNPVLRLIISKVDLHFGHSISIHRRLGKGTLVILKFQAR